MSETDNVIKLQAQRKDPLCDVLKPARERAARKLPAKNKGPAARLRELKEQESVLLEQKERQRVEYETRNAARLAEFNKKYAVVNDAGRTLVFERHFDPVLKRHYYNAMRFDDFEKLYCNEQIDVDWNMRLNKPVLMSAGNFWVKSPHRRQYLGGVIFDPSGKVAGEDQLNLWQGFAVEPRKGSWSLLRDHMRQILCRGNDGHFRYLYDWGKRAAQSPGRQGEVAVVLRGVEGCGKGIVGRAFVRLFGQHGSHISNSQHLVGQFNAHLEDTVFLFADEAFFAGDVKNVGGLKRLITEDTISIEPKFRTPRKVPNYLHILMASNEDWVVPASLDARRFFVLEVSPDRVRDFKYFEAIQKELDNGGYEAMLYDLLHEDLSGFNVRDVPQTEGLNRQREQSLDTFNAWWKECLYRGYIWETQYGLDYFSEWHRQETTELLRRSYEAYAKRTNVRRPISLEVFGKELQKFGNTPCRPVRGVIGERLGAQGPELIEKKRPHGYDLGNDLAGARKAFEQTTKLTVEWPDDGALVEGGF